MKFFDEKKLFHMDTATQDPAIAKADEGCRKAEASVTDALIALGRAYFEANRENPESEHHEEIVQIAAYMAAVPPQPGGRNPVRKLRHSRHLRQRIL